MPAASRPHLPLDVLAETLAVCRLSADSPISPWVAADSPFTTITRTPNELSITTVQTAVPTGVPCERDYRAIKVRGPLPLDLIGIFASLAGPLAEAGLSIFAISTYATDYILVKQQDLPAALDVLRQAGHTVTEPRN